MSTIQKYLFFFTLCFWVLPTEAGAESSISMLRQRPPELVADQSTAHRGMRNVKVFSYQLENGCASLAEVKNMTLVYEGPSSTDIIGIYAKVNGRRLTQRNKIDPLDMTISFTFPSTRLLQACSGNSINLFAAIPRTAIVGSKHRFVIELESDVYTDECSIGIPMKGPWIEIVKD